MKSDFKNFGNISHPNFHFLPVNPSVWKTVKRSNGSTIICMHWSLLHHENIVYEWDRPLLCEHSTSTIIALYDAQVIQRILFMCIIFNSCYDQPSIEDLNAKRLSYIEKYWDILLKDCIKEELANERFLS
jgi:hypothetical protein